VNFVQQQPQNQVVVSLDRTVDAPRLARTHARAAAAPLGDALVADAELLVSELVTNAVKYGGGGPVELFIERAPERLRFSIRDSGSAGPLPAMREPGADGGGHGLRLVDVVADRWGVEHGSTIVWFEFDLG
jgi:anti-sigma regulatory factor (Ser/Thr protein kinase)